MKFFVILLLSLLLAFANTCVSCHKKEAIKCSHSLHFTHKKEISLTLKAFGIKDYNKSISTLPKPKSNPSSKEDLAYDLLERKCLRCHIDVISPKNRCLACHNSHFNKNDSLKAHPTQKKCLTCHNGNFIGVDFLGLFPHDFDKSYRSPLDNKGFYPKRLGGIDYHHLIKDIHAKKGFTCISCHNNKIGSNWEQISCISCHKTQSAKNHPPYHKKISCIACHSAWQTNSYKSILLRSDIANYNDFKRLFVSEDPYLEHFLPRAIKNNLPPQMPNYLDNKLYKGIWYQGYLFRRWEHFFLINFQNKIELARPLLDFELTYINEKNQTILDAQNFGGFVVAKPHTIIKEAKSCEMCHENDIASLPKAHIFQGKLIEGKALNKEQIMHLHSLKYKFLRAKEFFK